MEVGWGFTGPPPHPHTHGEPVATGNDNKKAQGHRGPWRGHSIAPVSRDSTVPGSPESLSPALVSGSEA